MNMTTEKETLEKIDRIMADYYKKHPNAIKPTGTPSWRRAQKRYDRIWASK